MQVSGVYKNIAICGPDFAQQHFVFQRMGLAHTDIHVQETGRFWPRSVVMSIILPVISDFLLSVFWDN